MSLSSIEIIVFTAFSTYSTYLVVELCYVIALTKVCVYESKVYFPICCIAFSMFYSVILEDFDWILIACVVFAATAIKFYLFSEEMDELVVLTELRMAAALLATA